MKVYTTLVLAFLLPLVTFSQDFSIDFEHQADGAFLVEGCTDIADTLIFTLPVTDVQEQYTIEVSGSATLGIDYTLDTSILVFNPLDGFMIKRPILAMTDSDNEDRESIVMNVLSEDGSVVSSITITILDALEVVIEPDQVEVCQGETVNLSTVIPGEYTWIVGNDTMYGSDIKFVSGEELRVRVL